MKTIVYHPTGNANVRATAVGFAQAGMLDSFHTAIAAFPGNTADRCSRIPPLAEFGRRRFDPLLQPYTKTWPWMELARLLSLKTGLSPLIKHETGLFSVDAVFHSFDKHIASGLKQAKRKGAGAVYAYEDGALAAFTQAKQLDIQCLYDLPIGYWRAARRLLQHERDRWPEWASTLTGFKDSEVKLQRKDDELKLADQIFVASSFTASTLQDYPGTLAPIHVIPYGFPPVGNARTYEPLSGRPLRVLFVGGLSQRKGIADLFHAADVLGKEINLTVVGRKASDTCEALDNALKKHTWIPSLPHASILQLMREQDVLIFPSLFEGFGLVITEAMSQGTPVITTNRTAGPDVITHDKNGWLIEAGSSDAIQNSLLHLIHNPHVISQAGMAAMETARLRSWEQYGTELAAEVLKGLSK